MKTRHSHTHFSLPASFSNFSLQFCFTHFQFAFFQAFAFFLEEKIFQIKDGRRKKHFLNFNLFFFVCAQLETRESWIKCVTHGSTLLLSTFLFLLLTSFSFFCHPQNLTPKENSRKRNEIRPCSLLKCFIAAAINFQFRFL